MKKLLFLISLSSFFICLSSESMHNRNYIPWPHNRTENTQFGSVNFEPRQLDEYHDENLKRTVRHTLVAATLNNQKNFFMFIHKEVDAGVALGFRFKGLLYVNFNGNPVTKEINVEFYRELIKAKPLPVYTAPCWEHSLETMIEHHLKLQSLPK